MRSLLIGIGTALFTFSGLALVGLARGPATMDEWGIVNAFGLACFVLPCGVIAAAGSVVGLGVMDAIRRSVPSAEE
jgi:hypothetical protein